MKTYLLNICKISMIFLLLAPTIVHSAEMLDQVVAIIDDEVITQGELDQLLIPLYNHYRETFPAEKLSEKMEEARKELLNQLIEDKLIYLEAKAKKIDVTERELDKKIEEFRSRFPDVGVYQEALKKQGVSERSLRRRFEEQILTQKLHDYEVRSFVMVHPHEVEAYYNENKNQFIMTERIQAHSITLRKDEGITVEELRSKAEEIRQRSVSGEDFEQLAMEYSEDTRAESGGSLGWVNRGDFVPEIDLALFILDAGETSPVIESELGFHLFKVDQKEGGKELGFEETKAQIKDYIYRERLAKRHAEWINRLKKQHYISIR